MVVLAGDRSWTARMPMRCVLLAGSLPGRALHLYIVIWYMVQREGAESVRVNLSHVARRYRLHPSAVSRALNTLAAARLVRVERLTRASPVVTLVLPPDMPVAETTQLIDTELGKPSRGA